MQQLQTDGSYSELLPKTDAWTKDETLSAQVASVLGLRDNYKPDDAFLGLYFGAGTYRYRVRVLFEDGSPAQGCTVSGISQITGLSLVTDEQGYVLGKSTSKSVTISCTSPFVDQKAPSSQVVASTGIITDCVLSLIPIVDVITITSSSTLKVSSLARTVDMCSVGGGGGCGGWNNSGDGDYGGFASGGGGRGFSKNLLGFEINSKDIKIIIGSGRAGGNIKYSSSSPTQTDGSDGGETRIIIDNLDKCTGAGGFAGKGSKEYSSYASIPGGNGNGAGGNGQYKTFTAGSTAWDGSDGTVYIFNETSLGLSGGRGGAGGAGMYYQYDDSGYYPHGGLPYGGDGSTGQSGNQPWQHQNTGGKGYGGGGGGGSNTCGKNTIQYGGDGVVYLRFHF